MNEWTLCSEGLPREAGKYIITIEKANGDAYVTWAMFDDAKGGWNLTVPVDSSIIAWMFEPEPYWRLKHCPFCGSNEFMVFKNPEGWQVRCQRCGGRQAAQSTRECAIIRWNDRPYEGKPIKETQEPDFAF